MFQLFTGIRPVNLFWKLPYWNLIWYFILLFLLYILFFILLFDVWSILSVIVRGQIFCFCWNNLLRGLNFADHSIRKILTVSRGFNFAHGPFRNFFANFADKAVLEIGGWNKKNKNQLRNNNDFYVFWEISQALRFVSNKDCISLFKTKLKISRISLIFQKKN